MKNPYCLDYFNRKRFPTMAVAVGNVELGADNPIRVQSMTTANTMDTDKSVEESIRMIEAGCEIVRLTAPSKKDAENLANIKEELRKRGYDTPLVADIHFTPNAAEIAAHIVEKVRVNPGNYADKKLFEEIEYTDESYEKELKRIEEKFTPLVLLCKENNIAMRIGTNHGSLSDRILSRFGDTPKGMVESAMEFIRVCVKHDYHNLVLSMKASNTLVMVEAYRMLVATMRDEGMNYPLHLGVTEAGEGEDGRIKSAVGIGALLEDGLGDTIRVSLTENPEYEIPVAQKLLAKYSDKETNDFNLDNASTEISYDPFDYKRVDSRNIRNVGHDNVPVVVADLSHIEIIKPSHFYGFGYNYSIDLDKWSIQDQAADYVYTGNKEIDFEIPGTLGVICKYKLWQENYQNKTGFYPLIKLEHLGEVDENIEGFIRLSAESPVPEELKNYPKLIILAYSNFTNKTQLFRNFRLNLAKNNIKSPVILESSPVHHDDEQFQLWCSIDLGASLIDGFGDGIWLRGSASTQLKNATAFGILQATRTRISKTEYISCPSCGRTLFDLQETTAKIRKRTDHLKGIKIGIMGCIVNGPGEMADADYGYVGTRPGQIHLYKEKEVVRKNIPESEAVDALIQLIKDNGDWVEPTEK